MWQKKEGLALRKACHTTFLHTIISGKYLKEIH
jgi:hypothetical protein